MFMQLKNPPFEPFHVLLAAHFATLDALVFSNRIMMTVGVNRALQSYWVRRRWRNIARLEKTTIYQSKRGSNENATSLWILIF
jgi:hypothetical protein